MGLPYGNQKAEALAIMLPDTAAVDAVAESSIWPEQWQWADLSALYLPHIADGWNPVAWHDLRDEVLQQARRRRAVPPRE